MNEKILEELIKICLRIAKRGEGALIIVGHADYKPLVSQDVPSFNIIENPKLLESLAIMDGAVIVDEFGGLIAYGVKVKSGRILKNYGTKHSAAYSSSFNKGTTSFLVSEEERKIKVFRKGKIIMQIDALEKNIEKSIPTIVRVLESAGFGTIGTMGATILAPTLGIALIPGVLIFGSIYFLAKYFIKTKGKKNGS